MGSGAGPGSYWRLGLVLARRDKRKIIIRPAEAWQPLLGTAETQNEHYVKDWPCQWQRPHLTDSGVWSFRWWFKKKKIHHHRQYLSTWWALNMFLVKDIVVITELGLPSTYTVRWQIKWKTDISHFHPWTGSLKFCQHIWRHWESQWPNLNTMEFTSLGICSENSQWEYVQAEHIYLTRLVWNWRNTNIL